MYMKYYVKAKSILASKKGRFALRLCVASNATVFLSCAPREPLRLNEWAPDADDLSEARITRVKQDLFHWIELMR